MSVKAAVEQAAAKVADSRSFLTLRICQPAAGVAAAAAAGVAVARCGGGGSAAAPNSRKMAAAARWQQRETDELRFGVAAIAALVAATCI